jgi:hypothetical protein
MASIVLSFVGNQDPCSGQTNQEGSIITMLRHLLQESDVIAKIVLMHTSDTETRAKETQEWIDIHDDLKMLSAKVELIPVSQGLSEDPTDLLLAAQEARKGLDLVQTAMQKGDCIEFNASSGTPAMKSSLSILQAAGYAPNSRVWQVRNPTQIGAGQERVFETDVGVLRREFDLRLLQGQIENYNYSAAFETLESSSLRDRFSSLPSFLRAGIAWNRGEFDTFYKLAKSYLSQHENRQAETWWWMAYEQAYTAITRLEQGNTSESMQHSFRAVEGALWKWSVNAFPQDVIEQEGKYHKLNPSILDRYPSLRSRYEEQEQRNNVVELKGWLLRDLLESAIPATVNSQDFQEYWKTAREMRNQVSHRLGGLSEREVLEAWGKDIRTKMQWEKRILGCLNLLTNKQFRNLTEASLFSKVHTKVREAIALNRP